MTPRHILLCAPLAAVLVCAGCTETARRATLYVAPALARDFPGRVVIVPLEAPHCSLQERAFITRAIADEILRMESCDVIIATRDDTRLEGESALPTRAVLDADVLVEARRRYAADAFLFGVVTRYKPYDPPCLGLKVRLLAADSGDVLWAGEVLCDATRADTRAAALDYIRRSGLKKRVYGEEIIFAVPEYYAQFVAAEIVAPLRAELRRLHRELNP